MIKKIIIAALISTPALAVQHFAMHVNSGDAFSKESTCKGKGVSPQLRFSGIPKKTKSIAIVMQSKASDKVTTHWVVYNVTPRASTFSEGVVPSGNLGRNEMGKKEYLAPCPIKGDIEVQLTAFALKSTPQFFAPPSGEDILSLGKSDAIATSRAQFKLEANK